MIYLLAISDNLEKLIISLLLLFVVLAIWWTKRIEGKSTKVRMVEISACCIENVILTTVFLFNNSLNLLFNGILYIVFEETVLFSINDVLISEYEYVLDCR